MLNKSNNQTDLYLAYTDPYASSPESGGADESWLNSTEVAQTDFNWLDPFAEIIIPIDSWISDFINWLVLNFRDFFQTITLPIDYTLSYLQGFLANTPSLIILSLAFLLSWQLTNRMLGVCTLLGLIFIGIIGVWSQTMITLSLVLTALLFCMLIGLPLGILMAKNYYLSVTIRPILDAMQTTPAFVYLVPIVMLFGIGNVPGVIVTIIFALPPIIRLTILGITQIPKELKEASTAFGANPMQMLFKVDLPLAMPSIMAGVNQTLMLCLSMVVIASMIAVNGLGQMVLRGIGRLDIGLAALGGLGIVVLAILLDRLTQFFGANKKTYEPWYKKEPLSFFYQAYKLIKK